MMFSLPKKLAALAALALSTTSLTAGINPAQASIFGQSEVDQGSFVAVAQPFGSSLHNLIIIEQKPNKNTCWSESGSQPVKINPLLLNFDFSGHCGRSTDSNGYSIRIAGEDYGSNYLLNVIERDGELHLVGTHRRDRSQPEIHLGRTYGMSDGFLKIFLDPGWRFTKRTFEDRTLGHVYLTADSVAVLDPNNTNDNPPPVDTTPPAFADISRDIYRSEIEESVNMGFIAGFSDNTFRPQTALTREQIVSMVIEALSSVSNINVSVPTQATARVFPDVDTSRWSAAKIQWAQQNGIVQGYPDGSFKPAKEVTRAELTAIMKKAAQFAKSRAGQSTTLEQKNSTFNFSDTTNHWADNLIEEMSSYCQVATPLNEVGNSFYPDSFARRNYAAAATLRTIKCVTE